MQKYLDFNYSDLCIEVIPRRNALTQDDDMLRGYEMGPLKNKTYKHLNNYNYEKSFVYDADACNGGCGIVVRERA